MVNDKVFESSIGPIRYRGLKWGEKRKLREIDIDVSNITSEMVRDDEKVQAVLDFCVIDHEKVDELPSNEVYLLFHESIGATFLGVKEAKNSHGRQASQSGGDSGTAEPVAGTDSKNQDSAKKTPDTP